MVDASTQVRGETASIAGRVAAGVWAVGLVAGLIALATGHLLLAFTTLLVAVVAPWFGIAAVLHSKPRVYNSELHWQAPGAAQPTPLVSSSYRIRLPAR